MLRLGSLLQIIGRRKNQLSSVFENQKCIYFSSSEVLYSQITYKTHPHLLKQGEISPGIKGDVYKRRRSELLKKIRSCGHDDCTSHLVLIPSASVVYMSENIPYRFRQSTDFSYLCGLKEANSVLLLSSNDEFEENFLFVPKPTPISERWEGIKMNLNDTTEFLCIDRTFYFDDLENYLQSQAKLSRKFKFWYDFSSPCFSAAQQVVRHFIDACRGFIAVESPRSLIHKCRLIKSKEEVEVMQKTCRIAAESLKEVIKLSKSCKLESHLQAKMDYECCIRGADHLAFPPVVAGGSRANTIHYIDNNQTLNNNEMVLMDAGCEYGGYCSDLSRTWPIGGKFTDPQRKVYDLILTIQEELIDMSTEKPSLDHLFRVMCDRLGMGLQVLGIIPENLSRENAAQAAYTFCPHHVSHYLGMDVHDTDSISRGIKLLPGMIVTIEPGIYISKDDLNVPEQYRGICIRIEDDVLITESGSEILTSACPKDADEIERLMKLQL